MSYIVPRKKPEKCMSCPFIDKITYDCKLMYGNDYPDFKTQYENCPLIEIPVPHGRLIDEDKIITYPEDYDTYRDYYQTLSLLKYTKTVVEAEGNKNE